MSAAALNASAERTADSREFVFTTLDFQRISKLIYDHAGIALGPRKREMVYSRLARRLRERSIASFADYLSLLEQGDTGELQAFTNSLTTNLTAFFREEHHFPILAAFARSRGRGRPLTLWCSASSTGEEPYSMAITMAEAFGTLAPPVKILATDVDTQVLATAQQGVYPLERLQKMSRERVERYFLKGKGAHTGFARVKPELQSLITFRPLNLLDAKWPLRGPLDAIFCRNVMIYFDKPTQHRILEKFAPLLHDDGLLFAGHSESFQHAAGVFQPCGKTVYRRRAGSGSD